MYRTSSGLARAVRAMARKAVVAIVDGTMRAAPPVLREYVFRQAALELGVRTVVCEGELGRFEGDVHDRVVHAGYLAHRRWAPEFHAVANRVFAGRPGTLVDVGANIGLTSVPVARRLGATCHAFEPDPTNFALLRRNIEANEAGALVTAHHLALMDREGVFELERSADNLGDHRVRLGAASAGAFEEQRREVVKVEARRLDAVLEGRTLPRPLLLKVDVQGAEARVFAGAPRTLAEADALFVEYWPYGLRRMGDTAEAFLGVVAGFPWGGIVRGAEPPALEPTAALIARLREELPADGSTTEHLDVVLSRSATL
jgi:FkbM family methyltransferase